MLVASGTESASCTFALSKKALVLRKSVVINHRRQEAVGIDFDKNVVFLGGTCTLKVPFIRYVTEYFSDLAEASADRNERMNDTG